MGVATHLGINLREYDARIRTFIPDYEEMLGAAAAALPIAARTLVDLGTGTGALAARCLARAPRARVIALDADPEILTSAARRLGNRATLVCESFLRAPLPACDATVASFALHHIRTRAARRRLFARTHAALRPGGVFITVDCHPASRTHLARAQREAWVAHLRRSYTRRESVALLRAWSQEDTYVPLPVELRLLERSGFAVEVVWRQGAFAVIAATRTRADHGPAAPAGAPRRPRT